MVMPLSVPKTLQVFLCQLALSLCMAGKRGNCPWKTGEWKWNFPGASKHIRGRQFPGRFPNHWTCAASSHFAFMYIFLHEFCLKFKPNIRRCLSRSRYIFNSFALLYLFCRIRLDSLLQADISISVQSLNLFKLFLLWLSSLSLFLSEGCQGSADSLAKGNFILILLFNLTLRHHGDEIQLLRHIHFNSFYF